MKLVIIKQAWITDKPYVCVYDGGSGKPVAATTERFETEEAAREWCQVRVAGIQRIAEFELPDAP